MNPSDFLLSAYAVNMPKIIYGTEQIHLRRRTG